MPDTAPYLVTVRDSWLDADTSTVRLPRSGGVRVECSAPLEPSEIPSGYARPGAPRGTVYVIAWIGADDPVCSSLRAERCSAYYLDAIGYDGAACGGTVAA